MNKHPVKTGLLDQRDRATQSRRKRKSPEQDEPTSKLDDWLRNNSFGTSEIGKISLAEYLIETQHIDIEPAERLRQLAISLESNAMSLSGQAGWYALKRIYEYALKYDGKDEHVWLTMGISAQEMAENQESESLKTKIYKEKESAVLNALDISPNWSRAHFSLGYLYYFQNRKEEALNEFELTLNCEDDNKIHSWAQLYKAHCFHDEKKWTEALDAYLEVDLSAFAGASSWRVEVLREQIAECTFNTGKKQEAEKLLLDILDRYDAEPAVSIYAMSSSLWNVAESLSPKYVERAKSIENKAWESV